MKTNEVVMDWGKWVDRWNAHNKAIDTPKTIEVRYVERGRVISTRTVPADIKFPVR